jgi:pyruvate dehydrogenase kinase 2/3/4
VKLISVIHSQNSLRAVVERFGKDGVDGKGTFPPTKVIVVEGDEDITIKISDEGGGIPRSAIPLIWTYMLVRSVNCSST